MTVVVIYSVINTFLYRGLLWIDASIDNTGDPINSNMIMFMIILLLITFLVLMTIRLSKSNKTLKALNAKIQKQKEEIQDKATALEAANSNLESAVEERTTKIKDQGLKIIEYALYNSHNVRGPLSRILGLLNLLEEKALTQSEAEETIAQIKKSALELDETIRTMNETLHNEDFDLE